MADLKISQLTGATTPLAGTEVLPIVQSSTTKQVSVANLTAGRDTTIANLVAYNPGFGYFGIRNSSLAAAFANNALGQSADGLNTIVNAASGGTVKLRVNDTSVVEVATNTTLVSGNLVIGTSGKGIDFSATAGTGTSELLADYEEGTFTATLTASSTAPTTPVTATAYYTKIGRQVICQILFSNVNTTGASGAILIQGLPFTPTNIRTVGACNLGGLGVITGVALAFNGSTTMEIWDATQVNNISIISGTGKSITATITYTA